MNRYELTRRVAIRLPRIPKHDVDQAVKLLFDQLSSALESGGRCEIRGFGTFSLHTRKARISRNPKTGEPVPTPAKRMPHFKPSKRLKEIVDLGGTENPIRE